MDENNFCRTTLVFCFFLLLFYGQSIKLLILTFSASPLFQFYTVVDSLI